MKNPTSFWGGTAIVLLMASVPLAAQPRVTTIQSVPPILLVQDQPAEEVIPPPEEKEKAPDEEAPAKKAPAKEPQQEAPPAEEAPAPEPAPQEAPAPEEAPQPEPAPQEQPAPEEAPAPEPAPQEQPAPQEAPQQEPAPEATPKPEPAPQQQPAPDAAPAPEATPQPAPEQPAAPAPDAAPAPQGEAPAAPAPDAVPAPQGEAPAAPAPDAAPAPEGQAPQGTDQSGQAPLPEGQAPIFDSQKQQPGPDAAPAQQGEAPADDQQPAQTAAPDQPAAPAPTNDNSAQQQLTPVEVAPAASEKGTRREREPDRARRERPEGADVVREIGDRTVIQFNNQIIVESNDRPRMSRGAKDVYYEDLPRGRTRETIVRENGVQVVTIRNKYGDVIQRSRIAPDGRESVLSYVDDVAYEERGDWRDPGDDLPPMRLTIPVEEYILDADDIEDDDRYYDFLDEPPVEQVERLYSVNEVKRSARLRDKTRRIDLDTVTFDFGKASIVEAEIPRLEGVASAMEKILQKNPAETFLIEGHTDAVGTELANLALSDQRAEAVADALSNVFGIPPENLTTQGYGEQYLKVRTDKPEQQNRRVAIRRITALVAPVASAQ